MSLELVVLGSSGSGPSPGNPASGYLVRCGDTTIWMEAGTGTFMALGEVMPPEQLDAVVVSHMHPDHFADLLGLAQYLAHRLGSTTPMPTLMPVGGRERLEACLGGGGGSTLRSLAIDEVAGGTERIVGSMMLRFAETTHPVPTVAIRVDGGDRSLAYSADTGPGGGFPELAGGADVVLCEAGLAGRRIDGDYPFHLDAAEAGGIASVAGAGKLVLTHLAPRLDPQAAIAVAATAYRGPIDVATPGLRIRVPEAASRQPWSPHRGSGLVEGDAADDEPGR